jgi:dihydrodipicolinate synthase/N-acetylneuraminate lyase
MITSQPLQGIVAIPVTTFDGQLDLDEDAMKRQIAFMLQSGITGILANVNASEWYTLSDEERMKLAEIVVGEVSGQLPVFIGVTAQNTNLSIQFARHAQKIGAAGVNAMPPPHLQLDADGCRAFYQKLSQAIELPVILQNFYPPLGTSMSTNIVVRCAGENDNLRYIKEETAPEPLNISAIFTALDDSSIVDGVFGGQGGIYLMDELERGVSGNMPACHIADVLASIWEMWAMGETEKARQTHARLLPLMVFERCYGGGPIYKRVLAWRRVITGTRCRSEVALDEQATRRLDQLLSDVEDLLTI